MNREGKQCSVFQTPIIAPYVSLSHSVVAAALTSSSVSTAVIAPQILPRQRRLPAR